MWLGKIVVAVLILEFALCAWIQISPETSPKCFLATLFPHEDLLVELQMPIIYDKVQFGFIAKVDNSLIFQKLIQKDKERIRVSVDDSPKVGSIQLVEACITVVATDPAQPRELISKTHLLWFVQLNHFLHEVQEEGQPIADPLQQRFRRMKQKVVKLKQLYQQQLQFFHRNEKLESQNETLLEQGLNLAYELIVIESIAIILITIAYVSILKKYI